MAPEPKTRQVFERINPFCSVLFFSCFSFLLSSFFFLFLFSKITSLQTMGNKVNKHNTTTTTTTTTNTTIMASENFFVNLLGEKLLCRKEIAAVGETSTAEALASAEVIGLYFSAHSCAPCRGFTPQLAKTYEQRKRDGKKIEIVYVSSDKSNKEFLKYYEEMPWLGLPYGERKTKEKLSKKYEVQSIPTLVLLDQQGNVLTKDGRYTQISSNPKFC